MPGKMYVSNPGMDEGQMAKDRGGWHTEVGYLTGGMYYDYEEYSGPEVGNSFDLDPMGEKESRITFKGGEGKAPGKSSNMGY